jgi:hypothetical protein
MVIAKKATPDHLVEVINMLKSGGNKSNISSRSSGNGGKKIISKCDREIIIISIKIAIILYHLFLLLLKLKFQMFNSSTSKKRN